MRVVPVECLKDNYAYLVIDDATGDMAVVDPSEAPPVLAAIAKAESTGAKVRAIWNTHHHYDHVGGNEAVVAKYPGIDVVGHVSDKGRIPAQTQFVDTGDALKLGSLEARIHHIPGHTLGAIAYIVGGAVFTGDTLFLSGCGRLFEGTPAQMHTSLSALAALPGDTKVYCGHEYTESNLRFAAHAEPSNADVARAKENAAKARAKNAPTVPGTIAEELRANPFMRVASAEIRKTLGIAQNADAATAFAAIRGAKDNFQ